MNFIILIIFCAFFLGCSNEAEFDVVPNVVEIESIGAKQDFNASEENLNNPFSTSGSEEIAENFQASEIDLLDVTEVKDGLIVEYYEDGTKKSEIIFENGIKNGPYSRWHSNGELKERGVFLHDRLHGVYQKWNQNGIPGIRGYYLEGKQDGEWVFYDENGNPMPSIYYKTGVEVTRELDRVRR